MAPAMQRLPGMTSATTRESLQLTLRLAAAPDNEAYKVTLGLWEIDLIIEVIDLDLRGAIRSAAEQCAMRLRERGYLVTAADVAAALDEALRGSELVRRHMSFNIN